MNEYSKEGRISSSVLHSLCVSRRWFTGGSSEQYEELFKANDAGASITDIALIIWLCSDKETVTQESIIKTLRKEGFTELCNVSESERLANWIGTPAPFDYKPLADALVEDMCEGAGVKQTIKFLSELGITPKEMVNELRFNYDDVKDALEDMGKAKLKVIAFDTETTGFNAYAKDENEVPDEILQLSIVGEDLIGRPVKLFNEYFKPSDALIERRWDGAEKVNGISPESTLDKKKIADFKEEIEKILEDADVIAGYNGTFDATFLEAAGIKINRDKMFDVMVEFAPIFGVWSEERGDYKWQKLVTCADYYGFNWEESAHDSLGDTKATLYCYHKVKEDMEKREKESKKSLTNER